MSIENQLILDSYLRIMPFLSQIFEDIVITLSDLEKYVYYKKSKKLNHKIKIGDAVKPGSMTDKAYKKRGFVSAKISAEVFGVAYNASGFPILNADGDVIGGMVFCESVEMRENQKLLKKISGEIYKNMSKMGNNINSLGDQSEHINLITKNLLEHARESESQLQETNNILSIIKAIAYKTNILGINAAIESSRSVEGAGFKVVADEIRNLSVNTDAAIKKIEPIIKQIQLNSESMTERIGSINSSLTSITDFILQSREMSDKLSESSKMIDSLADTLVKDIDK